LLRGKRSFSHVVSIVVALIVLLTVRWYAIPILGCLYVAIPALQAAGTLWASRKKQPAVPTGEAS
jgi:hypothetical protein